MSDLKVNWKLISPQGKLVELLSGRPTELENGFSLRCEETIIQRLGYGSFHFEKNGVTGTVNQEEELTRFVYHVVVEGTSLNDIETVRQVIKKAIHVNVIAA